MSTNFYRKLYSRKVLNLRHPFRHICIMYDWTGNTCHPWCSKSVRAKAYEKLLDHTWRPHCDRNAKRQEEATLTLLNKFKFSKKKRYCQLMVLMRTLTGKWRNTSFYHGLFDYYKINSKVPLSITTKSRPLSTKASTMINYSSKLKEISQAIGSKWARRRQHETVFRKTTTEYWGNIVLPGRLWKTSYLVLKKPQNSINLKQRVLGRCIYQRCSIIWKIARWLLNVQG